MQTLTTVIKWEMIPQRPTDLQLPEKSFETKRLMYLDQLKDSNENSSLSFNNVFRILEIPPGFTNDIKKTIVVGKNEEGPDVRFLDNQNKPIAVWEVKSMDGDNIKNSFKKALKAIQKNTPNANFKGIYIQVYEKFDVEKAKSRVQNSNPTELQKDIIDVMNKTPEKTNFRLAIRTPSGKNLYSGTLQSFLGVN